MNLIHAIILGLVEGISEFLPISSTGHLILTSNFLGLDQESDFTKLFEIAIQTGAILSILGIYFKELKSYRIWMKNLVIGFLPSGILGFLFYPWIKQHLMRPEVVCASLIVGGIVFILLEFKKTPPANDAQNPNYSIKELISVGFFQCLAFVPGVSRSAATILGGETLGLSRARAVQLSFLLGLPTILSASIYSLIKHPVAITNGQWELLAMGLFIAFISSFVSVKIFLKFLEKRAFLVCGIYRIVVGTLYAIIFL